MAWIESHQSLHRHWKLARLSQELNITHVQAIGHLHIFWWWVIDYAPDGLLEKFTPLEIAKGADWPGDPDQFVEAMKKARFFDHDAVPLQVHDWFDFCGELVMQRCRRLKEKRRKMRHAAPQKSRHPTQPNPTNRTQPNRTTAVLAWFSQKFWPAYPNKKSKGRAEKAILSINPDEQLQDRILDALERAKTSEQWTKDAGRFIPHPASWLHAKGWEDEHDHQPGPGRRPPPPPSTNDPISRGLWTRQYGDPKEHGYE